MASCGGSDTGNTADTTAANNETTTAETTAAEEKEPSAYDYIKETDYDGYEFRIIAPFNQTRFFPNTLAPEEATGEIIYDSALERNQIVEEFFNIKISAFSGETTGGTTSAATQSILAGDDEFDIIVNALVQLGNMASQKLLLDAKTLDKLHLDMPWYMQGINDNLTILGQMPIVASSFECSIISSTYAIFFNQDLASKYSIPSLYEVALDGLWTHDTMMKYMQDINTDLNGDGVMDKQDQYGYGLPYSFSETCENPIMHQYGMNQLTAIINDDGEPVLVNNTERASQVFEKIFNLYHEVNYYPVGEVGFPVFVEGRELFLNCIIMHAHNYMRDMDDDYGVLPMPKFDEAQENYHTSVSPGSAMMTGFPITLADTDRTTTIYELLAYEGNQRHIPAFFETALKQKYARDEISSQVFDILRDGIIVDFGLTFDNSVRMSTLASKVAYSSTNNYASLYAALEPAAMAKYQEIIDTFNAK